MFFLDNLPINFPFLLPMCIGNWKWLYKESIILHLTILNSFFTCEPIAEFDSHIKKKIFYN